VRRAIASFSVFSTLRPNLVRAEQPLEGELCYVCSNDPEATLLYPETDIDLSILGYDKQTATCEILYNSGIYSVLFGYECDILTNDVEYFQTNCGCSNLVQDPRSQQLITQVPTPTPTQEPSVEVSEGIPLATRGGSTKKPSKGKSSESSEQGISREPSSSNRSQNNVQIKKKKNTNKGRKKKKGTKKKGKKKSSSSSSESQYSSSNSSAESQYSSSTSEDDKLYVAMLERFRYINKNNGMDIDDDDVIPFT
jgi:hypothetical protein